MVAMATKVIIGAPVGHTTDIMSKCKKIGCKVFFNIYRYFTAFTIHRLLKRCHLYGDREIIFISWLSHLCVTSQQISLKEPSKLLSYLQRKFFRIECAQQLYNWPCSSEKYVIFVWMEKVMVWYIYIIVHCNLTVL